MQLQARLVHAEPGSRVVEVSAHRGEALLGSALGEASTAEVAEDRALARLQQRLQTPTEAADPAAAGSPHPKATRGSQHPTVLPKPASPPVALTSVAPTSSEASHEPLVQGGGEQLPLKPPTMGQLAGTAPTPTAEPAAEPPPDPEDWSSELASLDLELRRLGWQREQEAIYLERVFNHPNRSRLTSYSDLLAYLQALEGLTAGTDPATAPVPLRRRDLLSQCDTLLDQLQWDPGRGRTFLEQHFSLTSRQQLSDAQLLKFNMLLESEWLAQRDPDAAG